jgi:hypothetical protein
MDKKLIVINLFSGPGAGKTTFRSEIFAYLKWCNINCEEIPEYAKKLTWQENFKQLKNQLYVFSKQHNSIYMVEDSVDVVVTDSPLLLSIIYDENKDDILKSLIIKTHKQYDNINIFIKRQKPYHKVGRTQSEKEARDIDEQIRSLLEELNEPYEIVNGTYDDVFIYAKELVSKLKK